MTKSGKTFLSVVCCLLAAPLLSAHGRKDVDAVQPSSPPVSDTVQAAVPDSAVELHVGILNGPTGIPAAYLYEHASDYVSAKTSFDLCATPTAELPKLLKGELDIGFLPANAAAKVYTKDHGALIALGISGNGNLSLLTTDPAFKSWNDLKGKKVAVAGQGATPEYIIRYILGKKNIEVGTGPDQIEFDFGIPTSEIAAALISQKIRYAVLPEPFSTVALMKSSDVRRAVNVQTEYEELEGKGSTYPLTLLVCRAEYAAAHHDIVNQFISAYRDATQWTIENPAKAGVLVQKYTLGLLAPIATKSIPNGSYVWVDAPEARPSIEKLLGIYMTSAPEAIGDELPADGFYYQK